MTNTKTKKKMTKWIDLSGENEKIWGVMQIIFAKEKWNETLSDEKLSDAIMGEGVFCSKTIARDIRMSHGIGNSELRKRELFSKQYKSK